VSGSIVSIVEGHGEVDALPRLLGRLASWLGRPDLRIPRPLRCPKSKLMKDGELERLIQLAVSKAQPGGAVLVLLDADEDCPKEVAPRLLRRARNIAWNSPLSVVLAKCEYEAWFLASIESLRGKRGIRLDAEFAGDPESVTGAKERIKSLMISGNTYSETLDQPALTAHIDFETAKSRSPSFSKLFRDIQRMVAEIPPQTV